MSAPTIYVPIASPPTPAPSPRPFSDNSNGINSLLNYDPAALSRREFASLASSPPAVRRRYLLSMLGECTPSELLFISTTITPLLKRDFLRELPPEIALHILSFIDDPRALARASQVSRKWRSLVSDECLWKEMCESFQFDLNNLPSPTLGPHADNPLPDTPEQLSVSPIDPALQWLASQRQNSPRQLKQKHVATESQSRPSHLEDPTHDPFSYRRHFKYSYGTMMNWRRGGQLMQAHRVPVTNPESGVVTSVALDQDWVVVGLANCRIHVFSAKTGVLSRTLIGHDSGVWAVHLVSSGGYWDPGPEKKRPPSQRVEPVAHPRARPCRSRSQSVGDIDSLGAELAATCVNVDRSASSSLAGSSHFHAHHPSELGLDGWGSLPSSSSSARWRRCASSGDAAGLPHPLREGVGRPSDLCSASEGWGQPSALVVSGGCDKVLRVWDVKTGFCVYVLHGHTSTIRCVKVLHNRPVAVTGSRDSTLRVWDVQRGVILRVLEGHQQSVRCLDVCGNKVVSGSYDTTCRLWNIDTGECIHVLQGHFHQIYSVAFDGVRIASGGLDTTVRLWDAATGICLARLHGHTALVCQLQLSPTILATGGSDGRVITFSLTSFESLQRIAAHDSSVTSLQFDEHFLVTGGNDGRVRLFETRTGQYVRELSEPCECVWKVVYRGATCAVMCKRAGKTVMEIWSFGVREDP